MHGLLYAVAKYPSESEFGSGKRKDWRGRRVEEEAEAVTGHAARDRGYVPLCAASGVETRWSMGSNAQLDSQS